jgi:hypothetical protein
LDTIYRKALVISLIFLLGGNIRVFAETGSYPETAFNQTMGLINIPTANITTYRGHLCVSMNSAVLAIAMFDYFEIGMFAHYYDNQIYCGNMLKIKLIDEEHPWPAVAVGVESETANPHLMNAQYFNSSYIVASDDMGVFGTAHVGLGNGRFIGTGDNSSKLNGLFAGIEKTVFEESSCPIVLKLEEDGRDVNFGVEIQPLPDLKLYFTVAKLDNWIFQHSAPDNNPTVSLGFCLQCATPPVRRSDAKTTM